MSNVRLSHVIGGESIPGANHFESRDPYRGDLVAIAPAAGPEEVTAAVNAARTAAPSPPPTTCAAC